MESRSFAALSPINHGYNMDPGAVRSGSDFEIAAKLARSRSDAINTNPWAKRRLLQLAFRAATIVSDYHVQPIGDPPQIDRHM